MAALAARPRLTRPARADREALFRRWNRDGDRFLAESEAEGALAELWPQLDAPRIAALAFRAADEDGEQLLDPAGFHRLVEHACFLSNRWPTLEGIDHSTGGRVGRAEFRGAAAELGVTGRPAEANARPLTSVR